jgi:hypothetical protein
MKAPLRGLVALALVLSGAIAASCVNQTISPDSGTIPTSSNAALKAKTSDANQYVTTNGNDGNDGHSWGTAKATLAGACAALPGGPSTCSGHIQIAAGIYLLGTSGFGMHSNLCIDGNGKGLGSGSTILEITNAGDNISYSDSGGTVSSCLRDLTIFSTTAAGNTTFIRAHGFNGPAEFKFNTIDVDFEAQTPTAGSAAFYATSDGTADATQVFLNDFRLMGTGIDTPIICNGCEGNRWSVNFYKSGLSRGAILFNEGTSGAGAPSNDETGTFRGENEAGPLGYCYQTTGIDNIVTVVCDSNQSGTKAINETGGHNIWDVTTVGTPSLGNILATSTYRYGTTGQFGTSGILEALATKSSSYTLTASDSWINVTGTTTITVPHAMKGQRWVVFNSGSNTVTLQADSGKINGGSSITLLANTGRELTCDGTNCFAH